MTVRALIETYRALRQAPMWKLLAADSGPLSIAILQTLLFDNERVLPASIFLDRLAASYAEGAQESLSRDEARALAQRWVAEGYLVCRLPAGAEEETYELTAAGQDAIRVLSRFQARRVGPTESRLEMMTHALTRLANDTDRSRASRIEQLELEKRRIDEEIRAIEAGKSPSISERSALERTSEILEIYAELQSDFRRVREEFERLNRTLRAEIMQSAGPRGSVLDNFFKGYDLIEESDAGLTFQGFFRLLTDRTQNAEFEGAISRLTERAFWRKLSLDERRRMTRMQYDLQLLARETNTVMKSLAASLRDFVQSHDFVEEKHLAELIRDARKSAHDAVGQISVLEAVATFPLLSAEIDSIARLELDDPEESRMEASITLAETPEVDGAALLARILQADIDYPALVRAIEAALFEADRASVGQVFAGVTNRQGLGSVVGLLSLAVRYGEPGTDFSDAAAKRANAADETPEAAQAGAAPQSDHSAAAAPRNGALVKRDTEGNDLALVGSDALDRGFRIPAKKTLATESLEWPDRLGNPRSASIPLYFFTKESLRAIHSRRRFGRGA